MESSKERYIPALGYKLLTPFYDFVVLHTTRETVFKKKLLDQAGIRSGHHVMDLGSGTGTLAVQIKQTHPEVNLHCIDGDDQVLQIAKEKAGKANMTPFFYRCYSSKLPFSDGSFDRVVSSLFFHHLIRPEKLKTIEEVFRVLKPGGEFHVADWGKPARIIMNILFYSIRLIDGFENTKDNVKGLLPALFEQCGFKKVETRENISTIYGTMTLYSASKSP